jgi:hypothetical protein
MANEILNNHIVEARQRLLRDRKDSDRRTQLLDMINSVDTFVKQHFKHRTPDLAVSYETMTAIVTNPELSPFDLQISFTRRAVKDDTQNPEIFLETRFMNGGTEYAQDQYIMEKYKITQKGNLIKRDADDWDQHIVFIMQMFELFTSQKKFSYAESSVSPR